VRRPRLLSAALGGSALLVLFTGAVAAMAYGVTASKLDREALRQLGAAAIAFAGVLGALFATARSARVSPIRAVLVTVVTFGLLTLLLTLAGRLLSTRVLLPALAVSVCLAAVPWVSNRSRVVLVAAVLLLVVAGAARHSAWGPSAGPTTERRSLVSALTDLDVVTYRRWIPEPHQDGGGIVTFGDGFLIADGDGRLFQLRWQPGTDDLHVTALSLRVPVNFDEYRAKAPDRFQGAFRVADLLAQDLGDRVRLVASHHFWNADGNCWVARLSETIVAKAQLTAAEPGIWRTRFESKPCLPLNKVSKAGPFLQIGGALAPVDQTHVLFALGDNAFDGVNALPPVPQDRSSDYGKTHLVDLETGQHEIFTIGHRNNHGAVRDGDGGFWLTEMGPQGGDELNHLEKGANFGWPIVTLGTQYGGTAWPNSPHPGTHDGFQPPAYAWVPSVAPTGLIQATLAVPAWKGDLIASSLRGESLFRIRTTAGRVLYVEQIPVGLRIRDLVESPDRLVLWSDDGTVLSLRVSAGGQGARLFGMCSSCHALGDGTKHGVGPDLHHLLERPIASLDGYQYSGALRQTGGRWTAERLDAFLRDPQAFAPGTAMPSVAIPDPRDRAALIAYLGRN
jgi:cytochrome c2